MRNFSFAVKNIGDERYLTYTIGEGCEVDEDVLEAMEEDGLEELVSVIYEEDDDFDYLSYDVSGKTELGEFAKRTMNKAQVFTILRNISLGLVTLKEEAIHLSYILLNKKFVYIDPATYSIQFLCLPVESDGSLSIEFKGFIRQLLAHMRFDVNEDLSYVGQLLTYINSDSFNLRGLIGLTEALMEDSGIDFDAESAFSTEDGTEIMSGGGRDDSGVGSYMNNLGSASDVLPEIGDDGEYDDDDDEEDTTPVDEMDIDQLVETATGMLTAHDKEMMEAARAAAAQEEKEADKKGKKDKKDKKAATEAEVKERIEEIVRSKEQPKKEPGLTEYLKNEELDEVVPNNPRIQAKNIRINRAALVQTAAEEGAAEAEAAAEEAVESAVGETEIIEVAGETRKRDSSEAAIENIDEAAGQEKASTIGQGTLSKNQAGGSVLGLTGALMINPYMIRVNTEEKIIITKNVFKIGKANRGVDYSVAGNGAISRQHAIITRKPDGFYIKDNKSTNHTYVNNEQVGDGEEVLLKNNCKIKLGDEEFIFKLG